MDYELSWRVRRGLGHHVPAATAQKCFSSGMMQFATMTVNSPTWQSAKLFERDPWDGVSLFRPVLRVLQSLKELTLELHTILLDPKSGYFYWSVVHLLSYFFSSSCDEEL